MDFRKKLRSYAGLIIFCASVGIVFYSSELQRGFHLNSDVFAFNELGYNVDSRNPKVSAQWVVPTELGQFTDLPPSSNGTPTHIDNIRQVFVSNSVAYITDDTYGLILVNITNPTTPTFLGQYTNSIHNATYSKGDSQRKIYVSGNIAYTSDSMYGLNIINVTDPTTPTLVKEFGNFDADGLYYLDNIVYLGHRYNGLKTINVTDPTTPEVLGEYLEGSNQDYHDVFVSENISYVGDYQGRNLKIINVTDPTQPELLDRIDNLGTPDGGPKDIYVSGDLVYIADYYAGLKFIDVSDPTSANVVNDHVNGGRASGVFISGSIAYLSDYDNGLEIVSVGNPLNPVPLGTFSDGEAAYSVYVLSHLAYVGFGNDGLKIIDVGYDTDKDGLSDGLETYVYYSDIFNTDSDNDTLSDGEEVHTYNTDPMDTDTDDDGIPDSADQFPTDTDNDGLTNEEEINIYRTDPKWNDTDNDELSDYDEVMIHNTNPNNADTDADGMPDGYEYQNGLEMTANDADNDPDGDGLTNLEEYQMGTDPNEPNGKTTPNISPGFEIILISTFVILTILKNRRKRVIE